MSFSPIPDYAFQKLTDVAPAFLVEHGITLLMLDLDNTIAAYGVYEAAEELLQWRQQMEEAGVTLYIVSNTRKTARVSHFAKLLNLEFVNDARKPFPKAIKQTMDKLGMKPEQSAICGDQAYTDVLGGNLAGTTSIVVEPIRLSNLFLTVRYVIELPFRALCRNKMN